MPGTPRAPRGRSAPRPGQTAAGCLGALLLLGPFGAAGAAPGGPVVLSEEATPQSGRRGASAAPEAGAPLPRGRRLRKRAEAVYRLTPLRDGGYWVEAPAWRARIARDGSVRFYPRRARYDAAAATVRFDVTDAVIRGRGGDPYLAQKLAFLSDTAPLRARLRRRDREAWRRRFFRELPARLGRIAARRDLPPARKRALYFGLWQECLEPGPGPERAAAGRARRAMEAFLRARIAASGARARADQIPGYTAAECAAIARRRAGRAPFPLCPQRAAGSGSASPVAPAMSR